MGYNKFGSLSPSAKAAVQAMNPRQRAAFARVLDIRAQYFKVQMALEKARQELFSLGVDECVVNLLINKTP